MGSGPGRRPKAASKARGGTGGARPGLTAVSIAVLLCAALASAVTWPLVSGPASGAHDDAGTFFDAWLMAWNHEALSGFRNPLHPPIFEGQPDTAGRSGLLLTQSLAALPLRLAGSGPMAAHNLVLVFSLAFAGMAAFLLALEAGIATPGALFSAGAFICLPFFQSHLGNIQVFSAGLTVLAVRQATRISRGRGGGAWLGLLAALQGAASLDLLVFMDAAILLLLPWSLREGGWRRSLRILLWTLAGSLVFVPLLPGFLGGAAGRPVDDAASADIRALVSPWGNSMLLGGLRPGGATGGAAFWPGLAPLAGAAFWILRRERKDRIAGGWYLFLLFCVSLAFSMGPYPSLPGGRIAAGPWRLVAGLPGFSSVMLPGAAAFLFLLPLILAAGKALSAKPVLAAGGLILCLAEVWPGPMPLVEARPERFHGWLAARRFACVAILPVGAGAGWPPSECANLLGQTIHFTPMVNGCGPDLPPGYALTAEIINTWPSPAADSVLEAIGVECLICRGFVPPEADPVWTGGGETVSAVVLGRRTGD